MLDKTCLYCLALLTVNMVGTLLMSSANKCEKETAYGCTEKG